MSDDSLIYGIPISELVVKEPVQLENGKYYNFKKFNLYVPDDVSDDTSAFIFFPGSKGSGGDQKIFDNIINSGNGSQILVIPDDCYRDSELGGVQHLELIDNIGSASGADIKTVNMMGYSAGGPLTFSALINTIERYPDNGPHNAVFCDVVDFKVTQEQIDILKKDNSTLLFFEPNKQITDFEMTLAEGGVNVLLCRTYDSHAVHTVVDDESLMNGIIDFASGITDTLRNSDIYHFQEYDQEAKMFKDISMEEVAEKFKRSISEGDFSIVNQRLATLRELRSENEYLASKVNNIRSSIRNTNFLSASTSDSYSSTTKVPSSLGALVQSFFGTCSGLLNKIEADTRGIIEIGESIDQMNAELAKDAEDLNQSIFTYTAMDDDGSLSVSKYTDETYKPTADSVEKIVESSIPLVASGDIVENTIPTESKDNTVVPPKVDLKTPSLISDAGDKTGNKVNDGNKVSDNVDLEKTGSTKTNNINKKDNDVEFVDNTELTISRCGNNKTGYNSNEEYIPVVDNVPNASNDVFGEFYDFEKLCSNDEYLVFKTANMGDNCKIIVRYDGNKVTGLEYYFDFDNKLLANNNVDIMANTFGELDKVVQKDEYVKVIFNEEFYDNMTLDVLKNNFSEFEEIIK